MSSVKPDIMRESLKYIINDAGERVHPGDFVEYNGSVVEVCFLWRHSSTLRAGLLKVDKSYGYSSYCLSSCPERERKTCVGSSAISICDVQLAYSGKRCKECFECKFGCKSPKPCIFKEAR